MTKRHVIVFAVLAVLIAAYAISILPNIRQRLESKSVVAALRSLPHPRLEAATEAFTRDHKATSNVALAAIPLQQLVSGGYLRAEEIRGLQHRDATVSLASRDAMLIPHTIWVRVRATDGSDIVLMVDGSVQKMPTR